MTSRRRPASLAFFMLLFAVVAAGCGNALERVRPAESDPLPALIDGRWHGSHRPLRDAWMRQGRSRRTRAELTECLAGSICTYYIRHVGDCVWWFGTEVTDVELGPVNQRGFANVASGRITGTQVDLEWVDVPLGDTVNGGGLTFIYDEERGELTLAEQRGGRLPFGDTVLTRIKPDATSSATPSATPTPCSPSGRVAARAWERLWHGAAEAALNRTQPARVTARARAPPRWGLRGC